MERTKGTSANITDRTLSRLRKIKKDVENLHEDWHAGRRSRLNMGKYYYRFQQTGYPAPVIVRTYEWPDPKMRTLKHLALMKTLSTAPAGFGDDFSRMAHNFIQIPTKKGVVEIDYLRQTLKYE